MHGVAACRTSKLLQAGPARVSATGPQTCRLMQLPCARLRVRVIPFSSVQRRLARPHWHESWLLAAVRPRLVLCCSCALTPWMLTSETNAPIKHPATAPERLAHGF